MVLNLETVAQVEDLGPDFANSMLSKEDRAFSQSLAANEVKRKHVSVLSSKGLSTLQAPVLHAKNAE